jgi:hypothetical protein
MGRARLLWGWRQLKMAEAAVNGARKKWEAWAGPACTVQTRVTHPSAAAASRGALERTRDGAGAGFMPGLQGEPNQNDKVIEVKRKRDRIDVGARFGER